MTGWRERLARLRDGATAAKTVKTAKTPDGGACLPPFGTNGSFGSGGRDANGSAEPEADRLAHLADVGAAALAAPDPDLADERAVIAGTMRAEAAGALPVKSPADHRDHLAGLELSALQRPPSGADAAAVPSPGSYCGRCSRHRPEAGGRWWAAANPRTDGLGVGPGWCCATCHPPPPGCAVREVRT